MFCLDSACWEFACVFSHLNLPQDDVCQVMETHLCGGQQGAVRTLWYVEHHGVVDQALHVSTQALWFEWNASTPCAAHMIPD